MKKLILLLFIPLVFGCGLSTEELAEQIEESMVETFAESDDWVDVKLVDFSLVHKGGNEYKGILELLIKNPVADLLPDWSEQVKNQNPLYQELLNEDVEVTYPVEGIYDGTTFTWEIITE